MQRFYYPRLLMPDMEITEDTLLHQIGRVMRAKIGEKIILFSWDGWENIYEIQRIDKKSIILRWVETYKNRTINEHNIHLYQAIPNKYEKIEYIIEKWVEVGIRHFTFFRSDFSQKLHISLAKEERFRTIAREALEQCGGAFLPEIEFVEGIDYREDFTYPPFVLHTNVQKSSNKWTLLQEYTFFVWPEWWWSPREIEIMQERGFIFVHFWERILRTETASSVFAFLLLHRRDIPDL